MNFDDQIGTDWDDGAGARQTSMLMLGLGGAGCHAVTHLARYADRRPFCVAVDTDPQELDGETVDQIFVLKTGDEAPCSAGGDPVKGRNAVTAHELELSALCEDRDVLVLVAGLGGGTGSGGLARLAELAVEQHCLVVAIVTTPFDFEGSVVANRAKESLREIRGIAHAVVHIDNNRLMESSGEDTDLQSALSSIDDALGMSVRALYGLLMRRGVLNLDAGNLQALLHSTEGCCVLSYGEGSGMDRVEIAVQQAVLHPVLGGREAILKHSRVVAGIVSGPELRLVEVDQVMETLREVLADDVDLQLGVAIEEQWTDRLGVTLLAATPVELAVPVPAEPVEQPGESEGKPARSKRRRKGRRAEQTRLNLDPAGRGRFADVDPTMYDGEDLDIPTFIRRGIRLSRTDSL